ncbi:hypothetical protein EXN66_Car005089 [Channa argus]|uniref:Uncharacterized protein n=1 Tax=Channa argus TaxID=215402 RepID=A0A6G1PGQ7_CHAAH|nr:hypothetical protein EXN66_Car005089 [Channa argus]
MKEWKASSTTPPSPTPTLPCLRARRVLPLPPQRQERRRRAVWTVAASPL